MAVVAFFALSNSLLSPAGIACRTIPSEDSGIRPLSFLILFSSATSASSRVAHFHLWLHVLAKGIRTQIWRAGYLQLVPAYNSLDSL